MRRCKMTQGTQTGRHYPHGPEGPDRNLVKNNFILQQPELVTVKCIKKKHVEDLRMTTLTRLDAKLQLANLDIEILGRYAPTDEIIFYYDGVWQKILAGEYVSELIQAGVDVDEAKRIALHEIPQLFTA
jgi:hypothetical protein